MDKSPITPHHLHTSRGKLPHWQLGGSWYFVTFRAKELLSPVARDTVAECIVHSHQIKYDLAIASVMPDHVHILLRPREKTPQSFFALPEIMRAVKGVAARKINEMKKGTGEIWQKESFDRIMRDEDEWREKYEYIRNNAVKAGLAESPRDYPWLLEHDNFIKRP